MKENNEGLRYNVILGRVKKKNKKRKSECCENINKYKKIIINDNNITNYDTFFAIL